MAAEKQGKGKNNPLAGQRVVFAQLATDDDRVFQVYGPFAGDGKAAKLAAMESDPDLEKRVREGGVALASVPAASWEPKVPTPPDNKAFKGL